jgi:choline-sulfatase
MGRPNILLVIADSLGGTLFRDGPAAWLEAPNLAALARRSRRFQRAYTATPLAAAARAALLVGCLPSRTGIFDDGAEFPASQPTLAHHLRAEGYRTLAAGRLCFVGPERRHGFEEILTDDPFPADFRLSPDWPRHEADDGGEQIAATPEPFGHWTFDPVDHDEAVAAAGCAVLARLARAASPWLLVLGFASPGPAGGPAPDACRIPYAGRLPPPAGLAPPDDPATIDPHHRRLLAAIAPPRDRDEAARAREAHFARITLLDRHLGAILRALDATGQAAGTVIVLLSDRGAALGDGGIWSSESLREAAARIPLMLTGPGLAPGLVAHPVSLADVAPTLVALGGSTIQCDGVDLREAARGPVAMEYLGRLVRAPMVGLVDGCWKYVACRGDPPLLHDLADDPGERTNLAGLAPREAARLVAEVDARWDRPALDRAARLSQARRRIVLAAGRPAPDGGAASRRAGG